MKAKEYLQVALGGNMNFGTLKPLAIEELMEQYGKHQNKELEQRNAELEKVLRKVLSGFKWGDTHLGVGTATALIQRIDEKQTEDVQ